MKKKLFLVLLCATFVIPANAVLNEKNISRTISVLRYELHSTRQDKSDLASRQESVSQMDEIRHKDMVNTVKWVNELTLILYSQEKGFTLNQTYATDYVFYEYNRFNDHKSHQFTNIDVIETEIERYGLLIDALKLLPPAIDTTNVVSDNEIDHFNLLMDSLMTTFSPIPLPEKSSVSSDVNDEELNILKELAVYGKNARMDVSDNTDSQLYFLSEEAQADRDSCIVYAKAIIQSYEKEKEKIKEDDFYVNEMKRKIQQTYDYAFACFEDIKDYIFVTGQEKYSYVLANLKDYVQDTANDMEQQYGSGDSKQNWEELRESQWSGIALAGTVFYSLSHLLLISVIVVLLSCVVLRKIKPFNTEWFKQTRPVVLLLVISVIYSMLILISGMLFPLNNYMYIAAIRVLIYFWLVIALLLSILIGVAKEDVRNALSAFAPILVLGLILVLIRALFIPDKMIHLVLTPLLLFFLLWQILSILRFKKRSREYWVINLLQYVTAVVMGISILIAISGFSLLAMMVMMWWIFQLAAIATITAISCLLQFYEKNRLAKKKDRYAASHTMVSSNEKGDYIRVTWLFDLIYKAVLPVAGIFSLLGCIWLALGVFNLAEVSQTIFHKAFFDFTSSDGAPILQISFYKLASVCAIFFIFRYFNYLVRSVYRTNKFEKMMRNNENVVVRKNDINLTLAYNLIGIIIWGLFVIYSIYVLKIPVGAISIVAAGLATGIGLALKDVLNNFIYGIQLMSGRLRVGDMLECDGVRGTVEKISYQSTEIQTLTGGVISFTNSTLFNKNFQNLTRNSPYEYVGITISIPYGEDVERVRALVSDELSEYTKEKDKYGRYLLEHNNGIKISFGSFGDSSVNLTISQYVLVEKQSGYVSSVKERVYKLFNDNDIAIPFPQQEISILNFPDKAAK